MLWRFVMFLFSSSWWPIWSIIGIDIAITNNYTIKSLSLDNNLLFIRRKLACEYDQMRLTIRNLYNSKFFTILNQTKSNQMLVFGERGKPEYRRRKTSRSREENQQTQPTCDAESGNRTRDTLVESERSHHYANSAPQRDIKCIS